MESKLKFSIVLAIALIIFTGCSVVDKIKEKLNSRKETEQVKEEIKEFASADDLQFYNKYIDVMNKIQEAADNVQKNYLSNIPEPSSLSKNSLIIPVTFSLAVQSLERVMKEYKRSFLDGGDLSKLSASDEMQNEIESDFRALLSSIEKYYVIAEKVSRYYTASEFKNDLSKALPYDEELKNAYDVYKTDFKKFSGDLKKYKPKRKVKDPSSISNPDERSAQVMLNAYGNILDAAEYFYENFDGLEQKSDLTAANSAFGKFISDYDKNKNDILSAEFTDKTKFMKYGFEDYFSKMADKFVGAGNKFFKKAPAAKDAREFRNLYNDVINNYNYMITAYNTSVQNINTIRMF